MPAIDATLGWLAERLGLTVELPERLFVRLFDGAEIAAELDFGRD